MGDFSFYIKGNYDESVIQIVLFGFVFTIAGDGTTEDYLGEGWIGDGADPGRIGGYHGRIKSSLPIHRGGARRVPIGLSVGIFFKEDKRQAKNYRWGN